MQTNVVFLALAFNVCKTFCISVKTVDKCTTVVLYDRYDSRVKAMEVDERPTEQYSDIGGLDKQIQEVAVSNNMLHFILT